MMRSAKLQRLELEEGQLKQEQKAQLEAFQQAQANLKWFIEHHGQLQDQYPNRLVAVYKGKVVATARLKDFLALLRRLDRKGIPRSAVLFEFIYAKGEEPNLIFAAA